MLLQSLSRSDCSQTDIAVRLCTLGDAGRSGCIYMHAHILVHNNIIIVPALIRAHVTLIFLNILSSTRTESTEAHPVLRCQQGVCIPAGVLDWWWQLPAQCWMTVWIGGMNEDSSWRSTAARSTGDIIIQKDGRLLRAECVCAPVCVCVFFVFTFIPYCA